METLLPKFVESGFSREGALFFSCHCLSPLHPYPHHLHDPRYASGFTYSLFHCHLVLRRGRILMLFVHIFHCLFCFRSSSTTCLKASPLYFSAPSLACLWPLCQKLRLKGYASMSQHQQTASDPLFWIFHLGWGLFSNNVLPYPSSPHHLWVWLQS